MLQRIFKIFTIAFCLQSLPIQALEFSASFKNVEISEFINITGKNLNKTIIVEPQVRGKINVRSYGVLNKEQYYQLFLNVLAVHGYAVVTMDSGILKVIRAKDAKVSPIPVVDESSHYQGDEMVTQVVPVINVSVSQLAPLLRQLNDNAGGGNVVHYDPANVIMLTGRASVVQRLASIIQRVDQAGDREVEVVELNFASATEMISLVNAIQPGTAGKAGGTILTPRLIADERTNSIIVSGEPQKRQRVIALIKSLDSELETNGNVQVFYLKYAKAKDMAQVLQSLSKSLKGESSGPSNIDAHEGTNSIVITAQPALMNELSNIIKQLDIRRAQVLVEAIMVEVSEGNGINLNIQLAPAAGLGTQFHDNGATTSSIAAGLYALKQDSDDYESLASVLSSISGGVAGFVSGDWGAILQAINSDSSANILATPSLTTLDNQEASFIVGDEVPVLTGSTSSSSNTNPYQTIERKEIGIKLSVVPQINRGDVVQLTVEQEVSSIKGATSIDVIFATREVKTTVLAKSGETIVIGGLIDEAVVESINKIPILGDIPYLGQLFRSTKSSIEKRNLMIFLRPTIIRDDETMLALSQRKYGLIRQVQMMQQEDGVELMPNTDVPPLPDWGDSIEIDPDTFRNKDELE